MGVTTTCARPGLLAQAAGRTAIAHRAQPAPARTFDHRAFRCAKAAHRRLLIKAITVMMTGPGRICLDLLRLHTLQSTNLALLYVLSQRMSLASDARSITFKRRTDDRPGL